MATVEVRSPNDVLIDGVHAGQALDVMRNYPSLASDVQRGMAALWVAREGAMAAEVTSRDDIIDRLTAERDALGGAALAAQRQAEALDAVAAEATERAAAIRAKGKP